MNLILLILVGTLLISFLAAVIHCSRSVIARVFLSLVALGLAAFCAFGFLASFEPSDSLNWPWHVAYGILGISSLATALLPLKSIWRRNKIVTEQSN